MDFTIPARTQQLLDDLDRFIDEVITTGSGPYSLRFSLAADFQVYGGQTISWALLRSDNGEKLVAGRGTISPITNPAFTAETGNVMLLGVPHEVHYWIDSNIGGGTPGECDPVVRDDDGTLWVTQIFSE